MTANEERCFAESPVLRCEFQSHEPNLVLLPLVVRNRSPIRIRPQSSVKPAAIRIELSIMIFEIPSSKIPILHGLDFRSHLAHEEPFFFIAPVLGVVGGDNVCRFNRGFLEIRICRDVMNGVSRVSVDPDVFKCLRPSIYRASYGLAVAYGVDIGVRPVRERFKGGIHDGGVWGRGDDRRRGRGGYGGRDRL